MPKSARIPDDVTEGATVHESLPSALNGINEELLKEFVGSAEAEFQAIDEIMKKARADCQPHVDQIKEIKKAAAEKGIPKKPFSAKLAERALLRKADSKRETLNEDQRDIFDEITAKLGDLPAFAHLV